MIRRLLVLVAFAICSTQAMAARKDFMMEGACSVVGGEHSGSTFSYKNEIQSKKRVVVITPDTGSSFPSTVIRFSKVSLTELPDKLLSPKSYKPDKRHVVIVEQSSVPKSTNKQGVVAIFVANQDQPIGSFTVDYGDKQSRIKAMCEPTSQVFAQFRPVK